MRGRFAGSGFGVVGASALLVLAIGLAAKGQDPARPPATPPGPASSSGPAKDAPDPKASPKVPPRPPSAKARRDAEPVVMSGEAAARKRGKDKPVDRYRSEPDWEELPPWRQTSFFGIKAEGKVFVYVVDCSGSMADDGRLDRAKRELRRSVGGLQSPQQFKVIFYNDEPIPMPGYLPKSADSTSKSSFVNWLDTIIPYGPTDPRTSIAQALALKPDAVFLLSDGAFPEGTADAIPKLNPGKIPIHCVDLAGGAAGGDLRKIADESGGKYSPR